MRLEECTLRRPDFEPGIPVTLADGQAWMLRKPRVRFVPDDSAPEGFAATLNVAGSDLAGLLEQRAAVYRGSRLVGDLVPLEIKIARLLLTANYDLTSNQLGTLLQFSYAEDGSDPEGVAIRHGCMEVAECVGPQPEPALPA